MALTSFLSSEELAEMGFKAVGQGCQISRFAHFYGISRITLGNYVRIDDFSVIAGNVTFGDFIHIATHCGLFGGGEDAGIVLEDFSGLSSRCAMYAQSDDYSGDFLTNPTVPDQYRRIVAAPVCLGKHAILGTGSTILPGVKVGEGAALGANSLAVRDLEPFTISAGVPARVIKPRSRKLLDLEQQFRRELAAQ